MALEDQIATLVARNASLFTAYESFSNGQFALVAGSADDPDSFDKDGLKVGPLGYYPVENVNGQTVYVPCIDRVQRELTVGVDVAQVPYSPAVPAAPATAGEFLNNQALRSYPLGSFAAAQNAIVPAVVKRIQTAYHSSPNHGGGAVYLRVETEPAHIGKMQTADGSWWELAERTVSPEMFGAIGNGDEANMAVDTYAVQNALDYSAATGVPVVCPEATYIIDAYKGARPVWTNGGRWTHGGIIVPGGAALIGAGRARTVFKNGANPARILMRVRGSGRTIIQGLTLDADFPNKQIVPYATPATETTGLSGAGLLYEGGGTALMDITLRDVLVKNTGGYGVGIQNVTIEAALIDGLYFEKVGADGIDIKSWPDTASGGPKVGILTNVFTRDGCGWNFIASGEEGGHDDQAVIDIGGHWHVSNVHIEGLTCQPGSTGNTGVRFRSQTLAPDGREGAKASTLTNFTIKSTKPVGVGTDGDNDIIGLAVYSHSVNISSGYIEGCRRNLHLGGYGAAENPDPYDVNISDVILRGANDATGTGVNFRSSAPVRSAGVKGMKIRGGDVGMYIDGLGGAFVDTSIIGVSLGITGSSKALRNYSFAGLHMSGNTQDISGISSAALGRLIADQHMAIVGDRQTFLNHVSLADDSEWTGEDVWAGAARYWVHDTNAGGPVEVARAGVRATGASGSLWEWVVKVGATEVLRADTVDVRFNVMGLFKQGVKISTPRQAWQTHESTANDGSWSGEDAWIGGSTFTTADTSGTAGTVGRYGFRATSTSGSAWRYDLQVAGETVFAAAAAALGFFGTTPVAKPTVTGSRGGNAALGDVLAKLGTLGLIQDSTTGTTATIGEVTAVGSALVASADAAAARTTLGLGTAATLNTGTSGATIPRNDTTNTFSANQVIAHPTAASILAIQSIDGQESSLRFRTGTSERWRFAKNNASETGANAGSNLILTRFDDAGASLGTALAITRSSGDIAVGGLIRPTADNSFALGGASNRWTTVFAATGTINTSDEREKHWVSNGLTNAEYRAGRRIIEELGTYQWLDAIAAKGEDAARWHFGVRAQRVFAIMEAEGLDWRRYAWCCHDAWDAQDAVIEPVMATRKVQRERVIFVPSGQVDEVTGAPLLIASVEQYEEDEEYDTGETREVVPARPAGDRYGIRTDQLAMFLIAVNDARVTKLEGKE